MKNFELCNNAETKITQMGISCVFAGMTILIIQKYISISLYSNKIIMARPSAII